MPIATKHDSKVPIAAGTRKVIACRFCRTPLAHTFVDLGLSPLCQKHVEPSELEEMERFYPLHVRVCSECFLVQLDEVVPPTEIFSHYAYFSSYVNTLVEQARSYVDAVTRRFSLTSASKVIEVASNDGYLLQHFVARGIPALGIEPAANVAEAALAKGIPTEVVFFGRRAAESLVREHGSADLLLGNNVLAHVPDINDFVSGLAVLLAEHGVITMEFPHLQRLIEGNQFDTIYHEHYSYLGFRTVERIFAAHDLVLFDVEEISTHGGSLRIYARHADDHTKPVGERVHELLRREKTQGFDRLERYTSFREQVEATKRKLLSFLIDAKERGMAIAGYGAPGKSSTLLNYCGIRTDFIDYTVDRNPMKQGNYLPGTRIPIHAPERIRETRPDYLLILPWNLRSEIMEQNAFIRRWGGQFVVPIPEVRIYP